MLMHVFGFIDGMAGVVALIAVAAILLVAPDEKAFWAMAFVGAIAVKGIAHYIEDHFNK